MNKWLHLCLLAAFAGVLTDSLIRWRLRYAEWGLDHPAERSLHLRPTPHGGGAGIVTALFIAASALSLPWVWSVSLLILALISMVDDWYPLPFWLRLVLHLTTAGSVVFFYQPGWGILAVIPVVLIAWGINAYNFMDGVDGLAGSMTVYGFAAYTWVLYAHSEYALAGLCVVAVTGAAVFLYFNWHPARIFMGDVGSVPLGFLAGGVGLYGTVRGVWSWWFPLTVFLPFLLDASVTLMKRIGQRKRFWQAHREHYYQRLVLRGLSHRGVCLLWQLMMALCVGVALLLQCSPAGSHSGVWGLLMLTMLLLAMMAGFDLTDRPGRVNWSEKQKS